MNVTQKPHLHQDWIDSHAIGIVRALQKAGFTTYLVGGCVRDLLLGIAPKDFDIATTALPDQVRKIIYRAYVIGRRFRLVLVRRDEQQFEVATFRREISTEEMEATDESDERFGDNAFGTPEEDAQRRDFTINGMFYDPINDQLIDYANGQSDLENRVVRMIGDPFKRLLEDPIRILRALRLKHMIGFTLDEELRKAMQTHAESISRTVLPRRREEILKWLRLRDPSAAFLEAWDLGVLQYLSPTLTKVLEAHPEEREVFWLYLRHLHDWSVDKQSPAELFALTVHAFVRSFVQPDSMAPVRARDFAENADLTAWMRDELGMFKLEQSLILKALQMQSLLARRREFQRRGERRQAAVLANEAFPLALKIAEKDFSLSHEDLHFWKQSAAKGPAIARTGGSRRRRRPRRGRPQSTESPSRKE